MQHDAAEDKQMKEFFSEVTVIRVKIHGKNGAEQQTPLSICVTASGSTCPYQGDSGQAACSSRQKQNGF